jgi:glutathione-regulated potassium-efflux system ancillary protein KefC
VAGIVAGFLLVKMMVLWVIEAGIPIKGLERPIFTLLLAQGGEFGFVVLQAAQGQQIVDDAQAGVLTAAITLSMLLTPLLILAADRWWIPFLARANPGTQPSELAEPQDAPVIIAGFGRYGQIVGRLLHVNNISATVLEHDAEAIEQLRRFGFRVHYGDATRLDLLRVAGAARARVLVVAVDGMEQSLKLVDIARENFPNLTIVARARNVQHWYQLNERGVHHIERETLDAALMSARSAMEAMGYEPHRARTLAMRFRRHSVEQLYALAPHFRDESKLIPLARAGRQQLEQLFAQERLDNPPVAPDWDAAEPAEQFDEIVPASTAKPSVKDGTPEH